MVGLKYMTKLNETCKHLDMSISLAWSAKDIGYLSSGLEDVGDGRRVVGDRDALLVLTDIIVIDTVKESTSFLYGCCPKKLFAYLSC